MRDLRILHGTLAGTTLRILRFVFHVPSSSRYTRCYLRFHRNHNLSYVFHSHYVRTVRSIWATSKIILGSERIFKLKLTNNIIRHVNGNTNRRKLMHRAKAKSLRISIVIITAFIIWWTPYYTMMIIFMFLDPDKHVNSLN